MNKKYSVDEALVEMLSIKSLLIIIVTAICFVGIGLVLRGQESTATAYTAISKLQVSQYNSEDKIMTLNSNDPVFLNTYLENLKNNKTRKAVKKELSKKDVKLSTNEIDSMVSIESVSQTTILKLKVSGDNKKEVKLVSRAYDQVAKKQYKKYMSTGNVKVVDYEHYKETTTTKRMSTKKVVFFAGVLGLFLSAGLIFLRKYFNQRISSANYIENRTATKVIANVSDSHVQEAATELITLVQNDYQVIGAVAVDAQQQALLSKLVSQLKEWQFNVKMVMAKDAFLDEATMIPETENELILVVGDLQVPEEKLVLNRVDALLNVVQAKVTTKEQLLAAIKFTEDAKIPFIGSLYLK